MPKGRGGFVRFGKSFSVPLPVSFSIFRFWCFLFFGEKKRKLGDQSNLFKFFCFKVLILFFIVWYIFKKKGASISLAIDFFAQKLHFIDLILHWTCFLVYILPMNWIPPVDKSVNQSSSQIAILHLRVLGFDSFAEYTENCVKYVSTVTQIFLFYSRVCLSSWWWMAVNGM